MLKEINSAHRMLERSHCHDGCGGVIEVIDVGEEAKPNKPLCDGSHIPDYYAIGQWLGPFILVPRDKSPVVLLLLNVNLSESA